MLLRFQDFLIENGSLTLEYHDSLNPNFWDSNDSLNPEVSSKLIDIAQTWVSWADIPKDAVLDFLLVGGNASYAYTPYSDIDVHILVDKSKIAGCQKVLDSFLKDKKELWGLTHDIKIHGHDVEVYAQDKTQATPKDQGCYSLTKNEWITKPVHRDDVDVENPHVVKKVEDYKQRIEDLLVSGASLESFERLKNKIKNMRLSGLKHSGELSTENLVFKELRNTGLLEKMREYGQDIQNKELSL